MDNRPIGIFDSGVGGLTAVKELKKLLPDEDLVYFGDTGRTPYGTRSKDTILRYVQQDISFLRQQDVKMIVAACGTASAVLTDAVTKRIGLPCTGVIVHAVQKACAMSAQGVIGVIGTTAAVRSGAYGKAIRSVRPDAKVIGRDCPLFVPLVENGFIERDNQVTRMVARQYLEFFRGEGIDTLILGCTHYPILYDIVYDAISEIADRPVTLIDPGQETAAYVKNQLMQDGLLHEPRDGAEGAGGTSRYYVSDTTDRFVEVADRFLGSPVEGTVEQVDIDSFHAVL